MAWGDLDNDGDIDLAISGIDENYIFEIYYRNGDTFTKENEFKARIYKRIFRNFRFRWDSDNDIIYAGEDKQGNAINGRYINTYITVENNDNWWNQDNWRLKNSAVATFNDGNKTTFIATGRHNNNELKLGVYKDESWYYPQVELENGDIAVADFNNDGYNDLLFTKDINANPVTELYYGGEPAMSSGGYNLMDYDFVGLRESTADFVDYDMDGDLDIFLTGLDSDGAKTILYEVTSGYKTNTPPSEIGLVNVEDLGNGKLKFTWDAPQDDFSDNIGYNIKLGTTQEVQNFPTL